MISQVFMYHVVLQVCVVPHHPFCRGSPQLWMQVCRQSILARLPNLVIAAAYYQGFLQCVKCYLKMLGNGLP